MPNVLGRGSLEALFDAMVDSLFVINHLGIIEALNPAAEQLFGYHSDELLGENISLLMPPDIQARHDGFIKEYLSTGKSKIIGVGRETVAKKRDGICFPVHISVGQVGKGDQSHFVGVIRDLSDQKLKEKELKSQDHDIRQLQDRLTHVVRISTLGEMSTSLAHELNQPLTVIATYAQACKRLIRSGNDHSSNIVDALKKIDQQAHRASKIINSIRRLAKKSSVEGSEHSCPRIIQEVIILAETYASDNDVAIEFDLTETPDDVMVIVDPIQVQQVILNLINNAIESMLVVDKPELTGDTDKTVKVQTRLLDTEVEIIVIDQGCGIDAELQDQIFNAFHTSKPDGLGIGLAICRSIISAQGGDIYFKNNDNAGCTFAFTLPRATGDGK
jgi:two-component system sensor kinase FixL